MNQSDFHQKLSYLYDMYNQIIKPLIADIEIKYQKFPDSIFNEIRAFNDHIARCYIDGMPDDRIEKEMDKAESHIMRIILDCYKYLIVWYYDYFKQFRVDFDISFIDNGEFAPHFYNQQVRGAKATQKAKKHEGIDKQTSFAKYQEAYNIYSGLYEEIQDSMPRIRWAKKFGLYQFRKQIFLNVWFWVASVVFSVIIPWKNILNWMVSLFTK